jgi:hypothetical protein
MEVLQAGIERSLTDSGAKIVERGSGRQGPGVSPTDIIEFNLRYSDGQVDGIVNVWGVRGQGTSLILIAILTESPETWRLSPNGNAVFRGCDSVVIS